LAGYIIAVIVVIAGIVGFMWVIIQLSERDDSVVACSFWWRKRRARKSRYSRVDELRDDDEPWRYYDTRSLELTPRMSITWSPSCQIALELIAALLSCIIYLLYFIRYYGTLNYYVELGLLSLELLLLHTLESH
jgi:hypothetical protein